jgi:hypothetical protein
MTSTIVHWLSLVAGYVFVGVLGISLLAACVAGFIKARGRRQWEQEHGLHLAYDRERCVPRYEP